MFRTSSNYIHSYGLLPRIIGIRRKFLYRELPENIIQRARSGKQEKMEGTKWLNTPQDKALTFT